MRDNNDSNNLLEKIKNGSMTLSREVSKVKTPAEKRSYQALKDKLFSECPRMARHPEDSDLLKTLKDFLFNNNITYEQVIGKNKVNYSTFYFMETHHRVNYEIFERIIHTCGYEIDTITFKKIQQGDSIAEEKSSNI